MNTNSAGDKFDRDQLRLILGSKELELWRCRHPIHLSIRVYSWFLPVCLQVAMKAQFFEVTHKTVYDYRAPVTVSHHLMRLTPRALPRQRLLEHGIEVHPAPAATNLRIDYFGNDVTFATIERTHRQLSVTSRSRVAVSPAFIPESSETPAWETVRGRCRVDRTASVLEASEFTFASPLIPVDPVFAEFAASSFEPEKPILEAVADLTARIHHEFKFDATATTVSTPLAELLDRKSVV